MWFSLLGEVTLLLTVEMLEKGSVRSVFENQHSIKGFVFMAIADYIEEVLVLHLR